MYAYNAALWCNSDGEKIKEELDAKGVKDDGDSDTYPQYVSSGETDCPNHCDAGEDCLEAETLSDGSKVGALMDEDLTEEGRQYVQEKVNEDAAEKRAGGKRASVALELWEDAFDIHPDEDGVQDGESDDAAYVEDEEDDGEDDLDSGHDVPGESAGPAPQAVLRYFGLNDPENVRYMGQYQHLPCWMNNLTGVRVVVKPGGVCEEIW